MKMVLTLHDVVQTPRPGSRIPLSLTFSEDGHTIYYLFPEDSGTALSLWAYDTRTEQNAVVARMLDEGTQETFDEEMRRQRARFDWEGITQYEWNHGRVLMPHHGRLYIAESRGELKEVPNVQDLVDAHWSNDGRYIYGVQGANLVRIDWRLGTREILLESHEPGVFYGVADYVAQEEMDRSHGYWLSPDDHYIAFTEVDERHVPVYPIVHMEENAVWTEEHRYPFVGKENAHVRLGITSTTSPSEVRWISWGSSERYLLDVLWTDQNELWVLTMARDHKHLAWDLYDAEGSNISRPYEERHPGWINRPGHHHLTEGGTLISSTEELGMRQVLLINHPGESRILTPQPRPEWHVLDVVGHDSEGRTVYALVARDLSLDQALVAIQVEDGSWHDLTPEPGWHAITMEPHGRGFIDQYVNFDTAPVTTYICGEKSYVVKDNPVTRESLGLSRPQLFRLTVGDGVELNGLLYQPEQSPPEEGYPLIVSVYAGPHAQTVARKWDETVDLQAQYLAQRGYVVMKLDSRGSANRGTAFEQVLYHRFGEVELQDQMDGITQVSHLVPIDRNRIGIYGWSYGGYMTLRALLMAPEVFKVGVAGAPVTDFRWYDTAYTERYLGTDENNHAGYERSALLDKAGNLAGDLLLIHGMVDENVHFRHSAAMIQAFIDAGKDFDLIVLPSSRHMVRGQQNTLYRTRRTLQFFEEKL